MATFDDVADAIPEATSPSFSTLESYVQDTLHKIENRDPAITKLVLDDLHFPHVEWHSDGALDSLTMTKMMQTAQQAIAGNDSSPLPSPLNELELRFVDLSEPEVYRALLQLLQAKESWKAVTFVGCQASEEAWQTILSDTIVTCCQELTLNHNSLPKAAFESLGEALREPRDNTTKSQLVSLHIQRETIYAEKAKALFGDSPSTTINSTCALPNLQELILNFCRLDAIASQTLSRQYLRRRNNNLQILNLGACYLQDHQVFTILNALETAETKLHTLILTLNHCHTQGSMALKELLSSPHCHIQHLNVSHQRMPGSKLFMPAFAEGLAANTTLQTLNLSRNRLNGSDMKLLMQALQQRQDKGFSPLRELNLTSNPLGRKGLAQVAVGLRSSLKGLRQLNVLSTGSEESEDTNDENDESLSADMDHTFEVAEAVDNLPLALVHGLHCNTSLEQFEFAQMDWLSSPLQLKKCAASIARRNSCGSLPSLSCGSSSSIYETVPEAIQRRSEAQLMRLVPYYLALNLGGRKLLASQEKDPPRRVPAGTSPKECAQARRKSDAVVNSRFLLSQSRCHVSSSATGRHAGASIKLWFMDTEGFSENQF